MDREAGEGDSASEKLGTEIPESDKRSTGAMGD